MEIRALSTMETSLNDERIASVTCEPKYQAVSILKRYAKNLEHHIASAEFYVIF